MASSSSKPNSSRFSSFKGFIFPGQNPKSPPPLPPKDYSQPGTPSSAGYLTSPSPSPSSSSLSPSSAFKKGFIRLTKRSLTPKSPNRPFDPNGPPPESTDDGSISLPWNFQHNLHVDEGYNGLPPTWSASLANLGYSEEEIEAIQYRRAASRSPSTNPYQFAQSPSTSTHSVLMNPLPRTSSLRRQASQASMPSHKHVPRKSSDTGYSYHSSDHSDFHIDPPPLPTAPPIQINDHNAQKSIDSVSLYSHRSISQPNTSMLTEKGRPKTPPHRVFRVTNATPPTSSPPPAYRSPMKKPLSSEDLVSPPSGTPPRSGGSSTAPPRLSLGQDGFADITSWTESLFSSVSASNEPSTSSSPMTYSSKRSPLAVEPVIDVSQQEDSPTSPGGPATIAQLLGGLKPEPTDERNRENRDSNVSSVTVTNATIVRGVEIATMTRANVVTSPPKKEEKSLNTVVSTDTTPRQSDAGSPSAEEILDRSPSPGSSNSHSSSCVTSSSSSMGSATGPSSISSRPPVVVRSGSQWDVDSLSPSPSPGVKSNFASPNANSGGVSFVEFDEDYQPVVRPSPVSISPPSTAPLSVPVRRPSVQVQGLSSLPLVSGEISDSSTNLLPPWTQDVGTISPAQKYRGWLSEVLAPLDDFIDEKVDPRYSYQDLREIAEGESGYIYEAREVIRRSVQSSNAPILGPVQGGMVAIKSVPILPSGSPKLTDLKKELEVMRNVKHANILTMDGLYVDLVEDSLWIKMELMERSLADVVALVGEGIVIQEKVIARFASDILGALIYLQNLGIAHRDLRSDNLLLNKDGVLKLADFSNAFKTSSQSKTCSGIVGVIYWQAPEVRRGAYNPLKADVWSLGATVWEMAQAEPPFSEAQDARDLQDRWPALRQPEIYSRSFHDFLHLCSNPFSNRPDPESLLSTPFIRSAAKRSAVTQLLAQCKSIEDLTIQAQEPESGSQRTVSQ